MLIPFQFNDLQNTPLPQESAQDPGEFALLPSSSVTNGGWQSLSFRHLGGASAPQNGTPPSEDFVEVEGEPQEEAEAFEVHAPAPLINRERLKALETEAREVGYQEGFRAAREEGLQTGARDAAERVEGELAEIQALKAQLVKAEAHLFAAIKGDLIRLLQIVPRRIIRSELQLRPDAVVAMAEDLLGTFASQRRLTLRAHPEDARLLQAGLKGDGHEDEGRLTILPDPTLGRADLRLITESGDIDAAINTQLSRYYRQVESWINGSHGDDTPHEERGQ